MLFRSPYEVGDRRSSFDVDVVGFGMHPPSHDEPHVLLSDAHRRRVEGLGPRSGARVDEGERVLVGFPLKLLRAARSEKVAEEG